MTLFLCVSDVCKKTVDTSDVYELSKLQKSFDLQRTHADTQHTTHQPTAWRSQVRYEIDRSGNNELTIFFVWLAIVEQTCL